jgi:hypothetical protein
MTEQQIAIFDPTYSQQASQTELAFWNTAIDKRRQEVIAQATTLHGAIGALLMFEECPETRPDTIIVAGRLQNDHEYIADPVEVPIASSVLPLPGKRWLPFSKFKDNSAESTILLPTADTNDRVQFPVLRDRHRKTDLTTIQERFSNSLKLQQEQRVPAMFIVAHTTRLLMPDANITIIGVSDEPISDRMAVDIRIGRHNSEAAYLRDRLAAM